MKTIILITSQQVWQKSLATGEYTQSTMDTSLAEVGYIHGTCPDQTMDIVQRFKARDNVVLVLVDVERVTAPVRYEPAPSGRPGLFPHIYGPLNTDAAYAVVALQKTESGEFIAPDELRACRIDCDIVLLPEQPIAEKAYATSKELTTARDTYFTLEDAKFYPHISLYMTRLNVGGLAKVKQELANVAASLPGLELQTTEYHQEAGYSVVKYSRNTTIDELQMSVVNAINPLRDGMRRDDEAELAVATGLKYENLATYGYPPIGDLFAPHITFTRLTADESVDTSSLVDSSEFSGQFTHIGLFEMGDHGTCVRKIAEFKLGGLASMSRRTLTKKEDMNSKVDYTEVPAGIGQSLEDAAIVADFLPSPAELVRKAEKTRLLDE